MAVTQNPNQRNGESDSGGIRNSDSGDMNTPHTLWPAGRGERRSVAALHCSRWCCITPQ